MSSCGSSRLAFFTSWSPPSSMTFMCLVTELCCQEKHEKQLGRVWGPVCPADISLSPGKKQQCGIQLHLSVGAHSSGLPVQSSAHPPRAVVGTRMLG